MKWQDFCNEKYKKDLEQFYNENPTWDNLSEARIYENFDEYLERVTKLPCRPFAPTAHYNEHGDMMEVYLSDSSSYGKWLTPNITLLLDIETNEITGVKICGVKNMIKNDCKVNENDERDFGDENDYIDKCIRCSTNAQRHDSDYCNECSKQINNEIDN